MRTLKTISILSVALAACGVKVNGTSYGIGGTSSASPAGASAGQSESESVSEDLRDGPPRYAAAGSQCYVMGRDGDHPPLLSSPADPWLAVSGDQPVELERAFRVWQAGPDCSAQHDHCLRDCVWFPSYTAGEKEPSNTSPVVYRGDGELHGGLGSYLKDGTLYRTVPATKRLLTRGAVVVALDRMLATPTSPSDGWRVGKLDRVDWKAGTIYMIGSPNPFQLSSTRVAVLGWRVGGKVEILGGRKRNELAVRAGELFLPKTVIAQSDPWSQVKDGQPIVPSDKQPFASGPMKCTPANDHCLRPWAWLVDNRSGFAFAARWDGKAFQGLESIDELERIDGIAAAYRTVPATRANVKVGAMVFLGSADSEEAAHRLRWDMGKVTKVRDDGKLEVSLTSSNRTWPIEAVRVPAVVWYPGEQAEAYE